jgi:acyl-CoA thioesterase I
MAVLLALGCACGETPPLSKHETAGGAGAGASASATAGAGGAAGKADGAGQGGAGSAEAMKLISRGVPAFASSGVAESANDDQPNIAWSSESLPAWLAYDVSSVPAADREQVLLAWYCYFADYLVAEPKAEQMLPLDYVVEINSAAGGGEPPQTGWSEVAHVTANRRSARQHVFELAGANWLRLSLTKSSDAAKVMLDLDLYSAPTGGSDGWLFMGDSITYMTTQRAFSDLPDLVERARPGRVPLVVDGALGGTNTTTAQEIITASLAEFEGRYIVLAYGTNDHAGEYKMESLVQKVIAAGRVPVVPHVPWSDQKLEEGPPLNQQIDALYQSYPEILRGPDLWRAFENRLDLIPQGDVHPNAEGMEFLRVEWSKVIAAAAP